MSMLEHGKVFLAALAGLVIYCLPLSLHAQGASESQVFSAGLKEFEDGSYSLAEKELAEFIIAFPQSPRIPEAILYQAQSALKQKKFTTVIGLLSTNAAAAGTFGDQYRYSLAEAQLQSGDYEAAAGTFGSMIKDFPNSMHLLQGSYGEAVARFRLRQWAQVIELLQQRGGTFQKEALLRPADELATRGALLLAEALIEHRDYGAAQARLSALSENDLIPEFKWRRQYLLCRLRVADRRPAEALANTTNLVALALASGDRSFLAESFTLQGSILEQLDRPDEAILAYEKNLAETAPAASARQALLKMSALMLAHNRISDACTNLEFFVMKHPDAAASDVALLTVGELHLRQHFASLDTNRTDSATNTLLTTTNHLQQALWAFEKMLTNYSSSPLVGRSQLDKGWSLWADGKIPQSQTAFQLAVDQLPHSEEQAVARFKLAEVEFSQNDYTNALLNFRSVLRDFSDLPRVKDALFDQALYQIARASLKVGDMAGASDAMKTILEWYPNSFFSDRLMLLVGQHLTSAKKPSEARAIFQDLARRYPESSLAPEIQRAIARTYVQESDWRGAIGEYESWLGRFPTNVLRPEVEFHRAWATQQSGNETNAMTLFTNLVARFPTHEMAARAQLSIGLIYYQEGDFVSAEKNFQNQILLLNTNYSYDALMMAGGAAYARQGYADAQKYFQTLVNDINCPPDFKAQAYFALGDTTVKILDPAKRLQNYVDAIPVYEKIPALYPASPLVPRAWGEMGSCYMQLATEDTKHYDNATNFYQKILLAPAADAAARSQAEVGLGVVLEAMAQKVSKTPAETVPFLEEASRHYANVLYEKNLREGETFDPIWLEKAGLAAGKLAEQRQQWEVAINIYKRLEDRLPPLRDLLEKKIETAKADQLRFEKK